MKLLLVIILISTALAATAQSSFQKAYDVYSYGSGKKILRTQDKGYIIMGYISEGTTLIKLDSNYKQLWSKILIGNDQEAASMILTRDNGYLIIGACYDTIELIRKLFVTKINKNGVLQWTKLIKCDYHLFPAGIVEGSNRDIIIAGSYYNDVRVLIEIISLDENGNLNWSKSYSGPENASAIRMVADSNNGFTIAGDLTLSARQSYYTCMANFDRNGNLRWAKSYVVPEFAQTSFTSTNAIIMTPDNGYATVCYFNAQDGILIKTDNKGRFQWGRLFGLVSYQQLNDIIITSDSGFAFTGNMFNNFFALKTNAIGELKWTKYIDGFYNTGTGNSLVETDDKGYMVTGTLYVGKGSGTGGENLSIVKFDSTGNVCGTTGVYNYSNPISVRVFDASLSVFPSINLNISDFNFLVKEGYKLETVCLSESPATLNAVSHGKAANTFEASLAPNPVKNNLQLKIKANEMFTAQIQITGIDGAVLISQSKLLMPGTTEINFNTSSLHNGQYFVRIITLHQQKVLLLVKQ